jgi:site-specific recombinase XerD
VKQRAADPLLVLVQSFIDDHLRKVRGASGHTVRAYAHGLRLFFLFLGARTRRSVADLRLDDITVDGVLAFLDDLESSRRNSAGTRNCRLAAIRGLVEHLLRHDVTRAAQYQRILALRGKKARSRVIEYLEPEQVRAVLAKPDRRSPLGQRDYALLLLLYNTGARIGEALRLSATDLHLTTPRHVRILGKGNKERICPLWAETGAALSRIVDASAPQRRVFRSARSDALSRDGVAHALRKYVALAAREMPSLRRHRITPHVLRHSCAVALLEAGVDVTIIRDYLGHASVATTSRYISTNVQMKRDVLEAFWRRSGITRQPERRWRPTATLLQFLASV